MSRYVEVRETLAKEISRGVFQVGGRFPTDLELCARFGVSRHTVREALRQLQDDGVLDRHRGVGTVVRARPGPVYTQTFTSIAELQAYAGEATLEVMMKSVLVARPALADLLGCPVGGRWLNIGGLRILKGHAKPLCWTDLFFAEPYIELRDQLNGGEEPFHQVLHRLRGVAVTGIEQQIAAVAVRPDIAVRLDCEPGSPGLLVRRRYFDGGEEPFEVSLGVYPADRYAYISRVVRRGAGASSEG